MQMESLGNNELTEDQKQIFSIINRALRIHYALKNRPGARDTDPDIVTQGLSSGDRVKMRWLEPKPATEVLRHPNSPLWGHLEIIRLVHGSKKPEKYNLYMGNHGRPNPQILQPRDDGGNRLLSPQTGQNGENKRWRRLGDLITELEGIVNPRSQELSDIGSEFVTELFVIQAKIDDGL